MQSAFRLSLVFCLVVLLGPNAQSEPGQNLKRNTAIILFSSLGGAILGLSTLSFYGQPENHLGNITTGAALGAGLGFAYVLAKPKNEISPFPDLTEARHKRGFGSKGDTPLPLQISLSF